MEVPFTKNQEKKEEEEEEEMEKVHEVRHEINEAKVLSRGERDA